MKFTKLGIVLCIVFFAWLGFIFYMSSQTAVASGKLSQSVTKELVITGEKAGIIAKGTSESAKTIEKLDGTVRNLAHMGMYFALACIIFAILWVLGRARPKSALLCLIVCIAISILDEINQMHFVGRNSGGVISEGIGDLVRDAVGAFAALVIIAILRAIAARRKMRSLH